MNTQLGKITRATFGPGGYQDAQFGLSVALGGESWGVGDFKGFWDVKTVPSNPSFKWTEADRDAAYAATMRFVAELLRDAKVSDVARLVGVPVEVTFDGNTLHSWRVLTEVL